MPGAAAPRLLCASLLRLRAAAAPRAGCADRALGPAMVLAAAQAAPPKADRPPSDAHAFARRDFVSGRLRAFRAFRATRACGTVRTSGAERAVAARRVAERMRRLRTSQSG